MNIATVRGKIAAGFSAVIVLLVAFGLFAYLQLRSIETQASALRTESVRGLLLAGNLQSVSISTYSSVQQFILEQDPAKIRAIQAYLEQKTVERIDLLKQYESMISSARQRELFEATKSALAPYMSVRREVEKLAADPKTKAAAADMLHDQLQDLYEKLLASIQAEVEFNKANADEGTRQIQEKVASSETAILLSLLIGVLVSVVAGYFLVQAINQPLDRLRSAMESALERLGAGDFSEKVDLEQHGEFKVLSGALVEMIDKLSTLIQRVQRSGLQVNTSATEIAATAQEQLSTATQVAATTSEIGATSKRISTTSKELAQTIRQIAEVAESTATLAGSGKTGLNRMKATMQQVTEASAAVNARLGSLSEKAGSIGAVVTTITRVADQTNLLSLNAAIEAEKAGDYGRGFAVVATEIRRLADQTALATGDIEQMVKEIQSAVASGVMGMDKFSEEVRRGGEAVQQVGEELSQIIHHVQTLTPDFENVSEGMQSQAEGAEQISNALSQLGEASKQTVDSLRQSNLAIEQLNEAARGLRDGVARFTLKA